MLGYLEADADQDGESCSHDIAHLELNASCHILSVRACAHVMNRRQNLLVRFSEAINARLCPSYE